MARSCVAKLVWGLLLVWSCSLDVATVCCSAARFARSKAGSTQQQRERQEEEKRSGIPVVHPRSSSSGLVGLTPQMVSLFTPEESEFDRYSAALAATEWLRKERDNIIKKNTNPMYYRYLKLRHGDQYTRWMSSPLVDERCRLAQSNYLRQAGRIITSLDISIPRFNKLSKVIAQSDSLKSKVTQQAYLYRVAAELSGDRIPPVEDVKDVMKAARKESKERATREKATEKRRRAGGQQQPPRGPPPSKLARFATSLRDIEELRLDMRKRLMEDLDVDSLPANMCRPAMGKVMNVSIRKACDAFPAMAERIASENGLRPEDFNRLSSRTKRNIFFKQQVVWQLKKLDDANSL